jgi:hypothetical protein
MSAPKAIERRSGSGSGAPAIPCRSAVGLSNRPLSASASPASTSVWVRQTPSSSASGRPFELYVHITHAGRCKNAALKTDS